REERLPELGLLAQIEVLWTDFQPIRQWGENTDAQALKVAWIIGDQAKLEAEIGISPLDHPPRSDTQRLKAEPPDLQPFRSFQQRSGGLRIKAPWPAQRPGISCARQIRPGQVCVEELRPPELRPPQVRSFQPGTRQVSLIQADVAERRADQVGAGQVRLSQV